MRPGILIAFEGIDGAGKTTQAALLAQALRALGLEVVQTKEPTDGPHGRQIRASARSGRLPVEEELALFLLDRADHVQALIQPSLDQGRVVIVDRYYPSTIAYQGARGLDPEDLRARNEAIAPRPDLLVVLDIAPDVGLARVAGRGDVADLFEVASLLARSRAIFRQMTWPGALILDATRGVDAVHAAILGRLYAGPLADLAPFDWPGLNPDGVLWSGEGPLAG